MIHAVLVQDVVRQVPPESTQQAIGYPALFLLVLLGSLVPVVPTGALVSTAAVVAFHHSDPFALLVVFALARVRRVPGRHRPVLARPARGPLEERLPPAGDAARPGRARPSRTGAAQTARARVAGAGALPPRAGRTHTGDARVPAVDVPMRGFARGDVPACLAWAAAYQLIGILGGSLFPEPWQGVVAAVALTLLISGAPAVWRRLRGA